MKKKLTALASVLLAGSLTALAACGKGSDFAVDGKFENEATPQETTAAISAIDYSKAFGDVSADDWSFGLSVSSSFEASAEIKAAEAEGSFEYSETLEYGVKLSKNAQSPAGFSLAGHGNASMAVKGTAKAAEETRNVDVSAEGEVYNDDTAIYLSYALNNFKESNIPVPDEYASGKYKILMSEIWETVSGYLPGDTLSAASAEEETGTATVDYIAVLYTAFTPYIDSSDGLKIKLSLKEEFLNLALMKAATEANLGEVSLSESTLDIYLVIGADGLFRQLSTDVDLSLSIENLGKITLKGGFAVKADVNVSVSVPSETLAADTNYVVLPLKDNSQDPDVSVTPSDPGQTEA